MGIKAYTLVLTEGMLGGAVLHILPVLTSLQRHGHVHIKFMSILERRKHVKIISILERSKQGTWSESLYQ